MSFTIFQSEKTPFQPIKTRSSKSRKIDIFPKGLTHGFGPQMAIFPIFFQPIQARKSYFTIFQREKTPLQPIKRSSSNDRKIDIFTKGLTHGFGATLAIFPTFFYAIQARNMSFTIFQSKKNGFLGYKNKKFNRSKNVHFCKGVNQWFWCKNGHFSKYFFQEIYSRKMSFTIFQNEKRLSRL